MAEHRDPAALVAEVRRWLSRAVPEYTYPEAVASLGAAHGHLAALCDAVDQERRRAEVAERLAAESHEQVLGGVEHAKRMLARIGELESDRDAAHAALATERGRPRPGQALFAALAAVDPAFAEQIRGTDRDPYHDDARMEATLRAWRERERKRTERAEIDRDAAVDDCVREADLLDAARARWSRAIPRIRERVTGLRAACAAAVARRDAAEHALSERVHDGRNRDLGLLRRAVTALADENGKLRADRDALRAAVVAALATLPTWRGQVAGHPGHAHEVPGVWDVSNGPPSGGKPCEECAPWAALRALVREREAAVSIGALWVQWMREACARAAAAQATKAGLAYAEAFAAWAEGRLEDAAAWRNRATVHMVWHGVWARMGGATTSEGSEVGK